MIDDFSSWNRGFEIFGIIALFFIFSVSFLFGWIVSSLSSVRKTIFLGLLILIICLLYPVVSELLNGFNRFQFGLQSLGLFIIVAALWLFGISAGSAVTHIFNTKNTQISDTILIRMTFYISGAVLAAGILFTWLNH